MRVSLSTTHTVVVVVVVVVVAIHTKDYLIVDTPPGTSDEHISTVQYLQKAGSVSGAVLVTTPEEVAMADVRKELNFCQKTKVKVLGLVENMGTFQMTLDKMKFETKDGDDCTSSILEKLKALCPEILETLATADLFPASGGGPKAMAKQYEIPYWGVLPMDPLLLKCCEQGHTFVDQYPDSPAAKALQGFCKTITNELKVDEV
jgi:Mrp family chromosome partitioning ATPase